MYTTLIDSASLLEKYENSDLLIFDTRYNLADKNAGKEAYLQGHIPGAVYIDLHDDLSRPPATNKGRHPLPTFEAMNTLFSEIGVQSGVQVIIYDDIFGAFAARLWWMLKHMQHEDVAVLNGGWQAWLDADGPVSSDNEIRTQSSFSQIPIAQDVIDIEHVEEASLLIDSREPARYSGETEPIDKAAGHIPNALNRFWKNNIVENGCFKEKSILRKEFEELLGNTPPEESVFYCGSGVTACHNLLAAVHAGLKLPKLYAGSWSEWSSSPEKPVATGN